MSRTFRRKNKEVLDTYREFTPICVDGVWCGWIYIKLEGEALKKALRLYHSEGHRNYGYSPPKRHRKATSVIQRMRDKTEIIKYINDSDYEPMVFDKIHMEYWT